MTTAAQSPPATRSCSATPTAHPRPPCGSSQGAARAVPATFPAGGPDLGGRRRAGPSMEPRAARTRDQVPPS